MATRIGLKDRLLSRAGAEAMMAPSGILAAGAAAATTIALGVPVLVAVVAGLGAWSLRVLAGLPRGPRRPRLPGPGALSEPWRGFVVEAAAAAARYRATVDAVVPGPLQDRLRSLGDGIDASVEECRRIATHGHSIDVALGRLDPTRVRRESAAARALPPGESTTRTLEALESQLATAARLAAASEDGRSRLRLLDARLDELVARAVELSLGQGGDPSLSGLGTDVDHLVGELESLRQALEEASGRPATGGV